ncbi:hypothetical protein BDY21DRAFT_58967 [Lineolata rhizophorae]|uniref:Fungal-specific transcription factor domain-containing protein n=1 Tax=Lineolata rhizophorae TaxID=578093 RepID=A0A6A6NXH0_9PEZI|nr:hypothetical protein BDY21DRAFT_58967 [Lineolata rhizophorae]
MVFCTYCGQEFARAEHLDRHVLTHTNVKPFKCSTCHFSFKRRDLLQRHFLLVHKETNSATRSEPDTAHLQRRPIACTTCAKAKTKCDKAIPSCSRCIAKGLKCESRSTRRSSDASYRQAKRHLNSYRKPSNFPSILYSSFASLNPEQQRLLLNQGNDNEVPTGAQPPYHMAPGNVQQYPTGPAYVPSSGSMATQNPFLQNPAWPPFSDAPISLSPKSAPVLSNNAQVGQTDYFGPSVEPQYLLPTSLAPDTVLEPPFFADDGTQQYPSSLEGLADDPMFMPIDPSLSGGVIASQGHQYKPSPARTYAELTPPTSRPASATPSLSTRSLHVQEIGTSPLPRKHSLLSSVASPDYVTDAPKGDCQPTPFPVQDSWPCFRCNPEDGKQSASPVKTIRASLDGLQQILRNPESWRQLSTQLAVQPTNSGAQPRNKITIRPIHASVRERLESFAHSFLRRARNFHETGVVERLSSPGNGTGFMTSFPPTDTLDHFLRTFMDQFETHYPFSSPASSFNPSELTEPGASQKHSGPLLLLLMIAQGASATSTVETRYLSSGLTEACRLSLSDFIDNNNAISTVDTAMVLRCSLLLLHLAAWSGDKWHMDIALGQRGLYMSVLRHSGLLAHNPLRLPRFEGLIDVEVAWKTWKTFESRNRLAYSWIMLDQELSLFHDMPPRLAITELNAAMPDVDALWTARSASSWSKLFDSVYGKSHAETACSPISLYELFRRFMNQESYSPLLPEPSALQLRLLLHPLQGLVCHLHQCLASLADGESRRQSQRLVTQLEEVRALLGRWYTLYSNGGLMSKDVEECSPVGCSTLVMFHLISLNTTTYFPDVERLARGEISTAKFRQTSLGSIRSMEEAVPQMRFHCGQVIRLLRMLPGRSRPQWWAAALYRVALILWAAAVVSDPLASDHPAMKYIGNDRFPIDAVEPEHPSIVRYLGCREGVATLSKRDGASVSLDSSTSVLSHCLDFLDEEVMATRFTDGIRARLSRLLSLSRGV